MDNAPSIIFWVTRLKIRLKSPKQRDISQTFLLSTLCFLYLQISLLFPIMVYRGWLESKGFSSLWWLIVTVNLTRYGITDGCVSFHRQEGRAHSESRSLHPRGWGPILNSKGKGGSQWSICLLILLPAVDTLWWAAHPLAIMPSHHEGLYLLKLQAKISPPSSICFFSCIWPWQEEKWLISPYKKKLTFTLMSLLPGPRLDGAMAKVSTYPIKCDMNTGCPAVRFDWIFKWSFTNFDMKQILLPAYWGHCYNWYHD